MLAKVLLGSYVDENGILKPVLNYVSALTVR